LDKSIRLEEIPRPLHREPAMPRPYQIVDADQHVNPPPTFWAEYLPKNLRELAPKLEQEDDADYVVFEGRRKKVVLVGAQAGRDAKDFKMEGKLSDARVGGWMPDARLADMDADGIDVAVQFGGGPLGTSNDELFMASFGAYNRWLGDFCSHAPDRLYGVAYVPMREVEETVALMREAADLGFTAVNIPAFPQAKEKLKPGVAGAQVLALTGDPTSGRRYDQPEFDAIWKTAVDLGLAVTTHLGGRPSKFDRPTEFLADMPMTKVAMAEPVTIMIYGCVFERFPELKFGTIESGVGWMAWLASYMDATWKKQRYWTKCPLQREPSFYMDQNIYGSFIDDTTCLRTFDMPGGKNIMWSSDYPHSETTYPDSQAAIERIFAGQPESVREAILGGIAKKFFRTGDGRAKPAAKIAAE
jgi:predicted TIM-barrel fold metal-dependent hydrolase